MGKKVSYTLKACTHTVSLECTLRDLKRSLPSSTSSGASRLSRRNAGEGRSFNPVITGGAQVMDAPRPTVHGRVTS